jgi:hypothetical protein
MTVDAQAVMELLQDLLKLTERFKDNGMTPRERVEWHKIKAAADDLNDDE